MLVKTTLSIYSALRRETLKHNVVDRDRILIPPQWDSLGKIKVIREGFDVEGISKSWGLAMHSSRASVEKASNMTSTNGTSDGQERAPEPIHNGDVWDDILHAYEETIRNPKFEPADAAKPQDTKPKIEVVTLSMQDFLSKQSEFLERLRAEEEKAQETNGKDGRAAASLEEDKEDSHVNQHLGPVQFNMGGIQVDAEDMLNRLRQQARE